MPCKIPSSIQRCILALNITLDRRTTICWLNESIHSPKLQVFLMNSKLFKRSHLFTGTEWLNGTGTGHCVQTETIYFNII